MMCAYCNMGDHAFRYGQPFDTQYLQQQVQQLIPQPVYPGPHVPWDLQRLIEYRDLLKEVRDLEEKLGCPCEPNKADYIALFEQRITELKLRQAQHEGK